VIYFDINIFFKIKNYILNGSRIISFARLDEACQAQLISGMTSRVVLILLSLFCTSLSYADNSTAHHQYGECRPIIQKFLLDQFAPWKEKGISKELLDNVSNMPDDILESYQINRIQFIDGEFYGDIHASWGGAWSWLTVIKEAHKRKPIKNFDAIFTCGDAVSPGLIDKYNDVLKNAPSFHINKLIGDNQFDKNVILLPGDYTITNQMKKIYDELDLVKISWQERKKVIGWRGAPSDGKYRLNNIQNLPRLKLVLFSNLCSTCVDAKFVNPKKSAIVRALSGMDISTNDFIPPKDMLKYRYLASVDGSASAYTRVPWIMYSDSTMLFQTKWVQWFYPAMRPWVHYVPLKEDLSDLLERYYWLRDHDKDAQIMASNAKKFVLECISKEDSLDDLALVLNEYAALQKFELKQPDFRKLKDNEFSIPLHNNSIYGEMRYNFWDFIRKVQSGVWFK